MSDTIRTLPLSALRESPFNPRQSFDPTDLQELADSIAAHGVMQPIVVRPIPGEWDNPQARIRYEVIFGHRRLRASALAGREEISAIVREMSDEEAAIAQVHENLKRKDVTALEEADSFAHLHKVHKMKAEAIMASVGKSRSYVYGRLKLASAAPEVRFAISNQGLSAETGLDIARLPRHDLQREALKRVRQTYQQSAEQPIVWSSVREAQRQIRNMFNLDLANAPFDLADAQLVKLAGACTKCPRRAGNDPALQGVLAENICLDSACYKVKEREHQRITLVSLRDAGHRIVQGDEARDLMPWYFTAPRGYIKADDVAYTGTAIMDGKPVEVTFEELLDSSAEAPRYTVVSHEDGRINKLLTTEQAVALLDGLGKTSEADRLRARLPHQGAARAQNGSGPGDDDDDDGEGNANDTRPADVRAVHNREVWHRAQRAIFLRVRSSPRTLEDLRGIVLYELDMLDEFGEAIEAAMGWTQALSDEGEREGGDVPALVRKLVDELDAFNLGALLVMISIESRNGMYINPTSTRALRDAQDRLAAAQRYGVDVLAIAAEVDAELNQKDDAGHAGEEPARDPKTRDMFEAAAA